MAFKHTIRNYYGPDDKRGRIPRNLKLVNNFNWLKGNRNQIKKNLKNIKIYTYKKNNHKWLVNIFHHNKNRRKLLRKHYNKHNQRIVHKKALKKFKSHHRGYRQHQRSAFHMYLLSTKSDSNPAFSNHGMRKLQNNDLSDFSDDFSDIINLSNSVVQYSK